MSGNFHNYKSFTDFYRIHFIGRPTELKKLVEDKYTFISSKKEANKVIKAHRRYYGLQYLGNILALLNYYFFIKITKIKTISNRTQIALMTLGISPIFIFYIFSHFSYWDLIRPVVLNSRDITNKLKRNVLEIETTGSSESFNKDEFKIFYNRSVDLHNYVAKNISTIFCLKEIFHLNKNLNEE